VVSANDKSFRMHQCRTNELRGVVLAREDLQRMLAHSTLVPMLAKSAIDQPHPTPQPVKLTSTISWTPGSQVSVIKTELTDP